MAWVHSLRIDIGLSSSLSALQLQNQRHEFVLLAPRRHTVSYPIRRPTEINEQCRAMPRAHFHALQHFD